jgi:hypothetical protein
MLRLMTDVAAIESYALHSGFTRPAILELQPKLARIARLEHDLRNLTGISEYWRRSASGLRAVKLSP